MELETMLRQVRECGAKAAQARWYRDESLARFQETHASRVYAMFQGENRAALQSAFREGYREEWNSRDIAVRH